MVRRTLGFHLVNHTGQHSAGDIPGKEVSLQEQLEYDILDTEHLLLHEYTVSQRPA